MTGPAGARAARPGLLLTTSQAALRPAALRHHRGSLRPHHRPAVVRPGQPVEAARRRSRRAAAGQSRAGPCIAAQATWRSRSRSRGAVGGRRWTSRIACCSWPAVKAATFSAGTSPAFVTGDMCALPFPDAHFDIVTTGYGLRNVPDLTARGGGDLPCAAARRNAGVARFQPSRECDSSAPSTLAICGSSAVRSAGCCTGIPIPIDTFPRRFAAIPGPRASPS